MLFKDEPIVDHYITTDIPRSGPMSGGSEAEGGTGLCDLEGTLGAVLGRTHVPPRSRKHQKDHRYAKEL